MLHLGNLFLQWCDHGGECLVLLFLANLILQLSLSLLQLIDLVLQCRGLHLVKFCQNGVGVDSSSVLYALYGACDVVIDSACLGLCLICIGTEPLVHPGPELANLRADGIGGVDSGYLILVISRSDGLAYIAATLAHL